MTKKLLILCIVLFWTSWVDAGTYYMRGDGSGSKIDATDGGNGGCGAAGTAMSIATHNGETFAAGDTIILCEDGGIFRDKFRCDLTGTGSVGLPITYQAATGETPKVSGAKIVTSWNDASAITGIANTWYADASGLEEAVGQLFFDNQRGTYVTNSWWQATSPAAWPGTFAPLRVTDTYRWTFNQTDTRLYAYSVGDPAATYTMMATDEDYVVYLSDASDYITFDGITFQRTNRAIVFVNGGDNIIFKNCNFYQGSPYLQGYDFGSARANAIRVSDGADDCEIYNNVFGKDTENPYTDNNWAAGFKVIYVDGDDTKIYNNAIYHTTSDGDVDGNQILFYEPPQDLATKNGIIWHNDNYYSAGIHCDDQTGGQTEIYNNTIYHTGSKAIMGTSVGDTTNGSLRIYDNDVSYTGLGGIALGTIWDNPTSAAYIYRNEISYGNRNAGSEAGKGNVGRDNHSWQGIHINTSVEAGHLHTADKVYVYDNVIHHQGTKFYPGINDNGGIAVDYYMLNTEVYNNLIYANMGNGMYIYNATGTKMYNNVVYGNNLCVKIGGEAADNNHFYNNTCFNNNNGPSYGNANVDGEVLFGSGGDDNVIKNNIFYAGGTISGYRTAGLPYIYYPANSTGNIVDYNIVYTVTPTYMAYSGSEKTWQQWLDLGFSANDIVADPLFANAVLNSITESFYLQSGSPAINAGVDLGTLLGIASGVTLTKGLCISDTWPDGIKKCRQPADWTIGAYPFWKQRAIQTTTGDF